VRKCGDISGVARPAAGALSSAYAAVDRPVTDAATEAATLHHPAIEQERPRPGTRPFVVNVVDEETNR
jgi:hypothetical protein